MAAMVSSAASMLFCTIYCIKRIPVLSNRGNAQRIEQVVDNLLLNASQSLDDSDRRIVVTIGHLRGAFTGADSVRRGMIEQAEGGTLFLDEIGDLSLTSQVKLLRLIQEGEYYPLGSDAPPVTGPHRCCHSLRPDSQTALRAVSCRPTPRSC
jgi:hypothetical protein